MSEDIKKEIETQITGTRLSIMNEITKQIRMFYISIIGMIFCLVLGFYIGSSESETVNGIVLKNKNMIIHTQKKIDLLLKHHNLEYK